MSVFSQFLGFTFPRFGKQRSLRQKSQSQRDTLFSFQQLESRELLAGINLDAAGNLIIFGGSGNDIGQVTTISSTTVRAEISGLASQDFDLADVSSVTFLGLDGNDQFTNSTSLDSRQIGGAGNDILIGGTGADLLNGGAGDDTLTGNAGVDRLIGFGGDDVAQGGDGDDIIIGGDGLNELFGDAGNDLIFGGADVDQLFGGDGADVLVGMDGDDFLDVGNGGIVGSAGTADADLALGFGGNDEITGGTGLNVLYGGDGDDIISAGNGDENRIHGQNGNDTITGNDAQSDLLLGQNGDDFINGGGGDFNFIVPGQGDDTIEGSSGTDRIMFPALASDYNIVSEDSTVAVSRIGQGFDRITGITASDRLQFLDAAPSEAVLVETAATAVVTVRPIIVSNNGGGSQAEFFGNAEETLEIQLIVDEIYATAGIDIEWEAPRNFNSTSANTSTLSPSLQVAVDQLEAIVNSGDAASGVGSSDPSVIDLYFVNQAPGNTPPNQLGANGFAFIGAPGIAFHTGSGLVNSPTAQLVNPVTGEPVDPLRQVALVAAHEIAHNLGLQHTTGANNLLNLNFANTNLTQAQINTIRASALSTGAVSGTLAEVDASNEALFQQPVLAGASNGQADSTTATGGCGGCGFCAACTGG